MAAVTVILLPSGWGGIALLSWAVIQSLPWAALNTAGVEVVLNTDVQTEQDITGTK